MAANGLRRGEHGLQISCMCEIPNHVIAIDAFSRFFDGFSTGSNDLTHLVLGVDRDSDLVAFDFDERRLDGKVAVVTGGALGSVGRKSLPLVRRRGREVVGLQAPQSVTSIGAFVSKGQQKTGNAPRGLSGVTQSSHAATQNLKLLDTITAS